MRPNPNANNNNNSRRQVRTPSNPNPTLPAVPRTQWVPKNSGPSSQDPNPPPPLLHRPAVSRNPPSQRRSYGTGNWAAEKPKSSGDGLSVPQLVQELQEKLLSGAVECMICYDNVGRNSPVWSCRSCFCIFHLNCIKRWAKAPSSLTDANNSYGFAGWRCPGCQSAQRVLPKDIRYVCFCGKVADPSSDFYLTPHSCGGACGKPLGSSPCVHSCVLQCHPGPCPPCKAFSPPKRCACGKKTVMVRCSESTSEVSCGQVCGKMLACGRHSCDRICHAGDCGTCLEVILVSCFCVKRSEKELFCGELRGIGGFECGSKCGKILECGNHNCERHCHSGPCGECKRSPAVVGGRCPCGKTRFSVRRTSCKDPIPCCTKDCGELLPCNHRCPARCHEGDCPPCGVLVNEKCRCGSSSRTIMCSEKGTSSFLCEKMCGHKKNCGRHRCNDKCCPGSNSMSDWDPHLCTVVCGKKLRCGQHSCSALCHSGHCSPCMETIFSDLSCACGKTSIPPPVPCGTPPPYCQLPCSVPQPCGHHASHSCHFGDCPPCGVPISKECVGGHVMLRNVPCGSKDIRCNRLCGKMRQCGMHACTKVCHPYPCDSPPETMPNSNRNSCGQVCSAPRRECKHTCTAMCHPMAQCPDIRCESPVTIACSCGRITVSVPCGAGGNGLDAVLEAAVVQKLPAPLQPLDPSLKRVPIGQRKLACDEECAKLEKKKVLADAFGISSAAANMDSLHFGENGGSLSQLLMDLMRREPKWVLAIEERFKHMVLSKGKGGGRGNGMRVHVFCVMNKEKRDAVRQIAERWKLTVNAAGWEPKRFLIVHVTPKSKPPARILGSKGGTTVGVAVPPPLFDQYIDMDPRLVVAFLDLPRDADISGLVLRFGGECELVWLTDKDALAVFGDPARAMTALRRLDHGVAYQGAAVIPVGGVNKSNAWGVESGSSSTTGNSPCKKTLQGPSSTQKTTSGMMGWWSAQDNWGGSECISPVWRGKDEAVVVSKNPWDVLEKEDAVQSASASSSSHLHPLMNDNANNNNNNIDRIEEVGEVEDWEQAFE